MPPDLPVDWLYETLKRIEDRIGKHTVEMRAEMQQGFRDLTRQFEIHEQFDRETEKRVTVIETERSLEAKQAVKRGTWAGILAAAGLTGLIEVAKAMARTLRP